MRKLFFLAACLVLFISSCSYSGRLKAAANAPIRTPNSNIAASADPSETSILPVSQQSPIQSAYPLAPGATWTYRAEIGYQDPTTATNLSTWTGSIVDQVITQETIADGEIIFSIQEDFDPLPPQGVWLRPRAFQIRLTREAVFKDDRKILSWPLMDGQSWEPSPGFGYDVTVSAVPSVRTALGQQAGCFQLILQTNPDAQTDIFCHGIGFVEHSYQHRGTPQIEHFTLEAFTPGQ
jgi:hypothetical protein